MFIMQNGSCFVKDTMQGSFIFTHSPQHKLKAKKYICSAPLSFSFNITAYIYMVMYRSARNQCPQDYFKIAAERSPALYAFTVQMRKCQV